MVHEPAAVGRLALMYGLFERVQYETGMRRSADAPANDAARKGINYESHVDAALPCGHVGIIQICRGHQASRDLDVHATILRKWMKAFSADPKDAFPGKGQMKPEQLEIDRLRKEVAKLKAERDILKKAAAYVARDSRLLTNALNMAIWRRGKPDALLHHSDQGSQYTSEQFQRLMTDNGVTCSMSRSGNVWDNAAMESFFSSLKTERIGKKIYRTRD